jgi:deoxyribonuclease V
MAGVKYLPNFLADPMKVDRLVQTQLQLARQVIVRDCLPRRIRTIGGVDQAFLDNELISALIVCEFPTLRVIEKRYVAVRATFPYVPGLLAFREGPAILRVLKRSKTRPDILLLDGHGILHVRRIGIASHIGVLTDLATIGVAKRLLCGKLRGDKVVCEGEIRGVALITKTGCRPIFISPGHKVSLETSLEVVKRCLTGHKLPEPLRLAHLYADEIKRGMTRK